MTTTTTRQGRAYGLSSLLFLVAVIIFALGIFGVHVGSVQGDRWTDLGLVFLAAAFLVGG